MLKIDAENQTGQTGRSGVSAAPVRAVVACGWWVPDTDVLKTLISDWLDGFSRGG